MLDVPTCYSFVSIVFESDQTLPQVQRKQEDNRPKKYEYSNAGSLINVDPQIFTCKLWSYTQFVLNLQEASIQHLLFVK